MSCDLHQKYLQIVATNRSERATRFSFFGSDAALKSRGNLCFFEDVGVEGFFAF
jgi:hypothetical protein